MMKQLFFAVTCLFIYTPAMATMAYQGFSRFLNNKIFVETGTYQGDGILQALEDGFTNIRSIEFHAHFADETKRRLAKHPLAANKNIQIFHGNSAVDLWDVIKDINEPITFWLDAHTYGSTTNCPVLQELDQIKRHPIKTHTILIDDMRIFNTVSFDYISQQDIIKKILEINPNYQITYVDGFAQNDVMVAQIK